MLAKGFRLTFVALVLGWIMCLGALGRMADPNNDNRQRSQITMLGGVYMLIGAYAYRSAKRRKLGFKKSSAARVILEGLGIAFVVVHPLTKFPPRLIVEDPVVPLVIPAWVLVWFIAINLRGKTKIAVELPSEQRGKSELADLDYDALVIMAREMGLEHGGWPSKDEIVKQIQEHISQQNRSGTNTDELDS